jgi:hypothetical protein
MAKYMALIYGDESAWRNLTQAQARENGERHRAFAELAGTAVLAGAELDSTDTARSIRSGPDGHPLVSDGPFVETTEVLGGYYVLEAEDLDAAVALAARLPEASVSHSGVEVRPLVGNA